mgnify:CR=1 FL=1
MSAAPEDARPAQALLFTGHRIDAPRHPRPRVPAAAEPGGTSAMVTRARANDARIELQDARVGHGGLGERPNPFQLRRGAEPACDLQPPGLGMVGGKRVDHGHRAQDVLVRRSRRIRAMNWAVAGADEVALGTYFTTESEYFSLHKHKSRDTTAVCSVPLPVRRDWTALPSGTVEVIS